jgi:hypothetical protein
MRKLESYKDEGKSGIMKVFNFDSLTKKDNSQKPKLFKGLSSAQN